MPAVAAVTCHSLRRLEHKGTLQCQSWIWSGELHLSNKIGRDCRICHLSLESSTATTGEEEQYNGVAIELGRCCKGDLSSAHKKCSDTWFKIKGNTTREICGATALNIAGEQSPQQEQQQQVQGYSWKAKHFSIAEDDGVNGRKLERKSVASDDQKLNGHCVDIAPADTRLNEMAANSSKPTATGVEVEAHKFWDGRRITNFLLACLPFPIAIWILLKLLQ